MRIHIELDQCEGHGQCHSVDPDLYRLDEDGYAERSDIVVPAGAGATAAAGVSACPMGAIRLLDD